MGEIIPMFDRPRRVAAVVPAAILKAKEEPGVYLASLPGSDSFTVLLVTNDGCVRQMALDSILVDDRWTPDVVIRGPLNMERAPL